MGEPFYGLSVSRVASYAARTEGVAEAWSFGDSAQKTEIKKRLVEYAARKELDFPQAEMAASQVAERLNEETIEKVVDALEGKTV